MQPGQESMLEDCALEKGKSRKERAKSTRAKWAGLTTGIGAGRVNINFDGKMRA